MQGAKQPSPPPAFLLRTMQAAQRAVLSIGNKMAPPHIQMINLVAGAMNSQMIHAAAELGLADALAHGPLTCRALAEQVQVNADALSRLLRALASIGVFEQDAEGRYGLTPLAESLRSDAFPSVLPLALLIGHPTWRDPWGALTDSVRTGEAAFERLYGQRYFEHLADNPDVSRTFDQWMTRVSEMSSIFVVSSYDFRGIDRIVDVGGGQGALLSAILDKHPAMKGVLFDQPHVLEEAVKIPRGLRDRCELEGGDFFEAVPAGADAYIMQQIIHDWDDELAVKILRNCAEAMSEGGRVLVADAVLKPGNTADFNKVLDLQMMLINHGGRERTETDFQALFQAAGLRLTSVTPTPAMLCIVEGMKI